uniref:Uncharacterized protein n=1 Tax=viral metagenome TaxID=1070528 RepID=A0A6C0ADQ4_9ZZZZ
MFFTDTPLRLLSGFDVGISSINVIIINSIIKVFKKIRESINFYNIFYF